MKHFIKILSISSLLAASLSVFGQSGTETEVAAESREPLQKMQALEQLAGRWELSMEVLAEDGVTWEAAPPQIVELSFRHKGLMLAELPTDLSTPGFHMETYITWDQYRDVYRKVAIDDVWGIMDIYDGVREGNTIVFTNLRSGTTFPISDTVSRNFRLTMEIASPQRSFIVDKSDDGGRSWQPAFRQSYRLID
ncbi:MAG: hypothetical protein MRY76_04550 [Pseudomonadales bacterium]|nr:hypothetical protein [Pseudomonadales bacterium]